MAGLLNGAGGVTEAGQDPRLDVDITNPVS